MWNWLQDNAEPVSAIASIMTLLVWALYLQLIYSSYARDRRAKILINRGAGHSIEARCVISNMSSSPVYIDAVRLSLKNDEWQTTCSLGDLDVAVEPDKDPRPQWMQGPLASAEMMDIGTYRSLIERAFDKILDHEWEDRVNPILYLNMQIVATFTAEDLPVAASRDFKLERMGETIHLQPLRASTWQIRSKRARKQIKTSLQNEIESESDGSLPQATYRR